MIEAIIEIMSHPFVMIGGGGMLIMLAIGKYAEWYQHRHARKQRQAKANANA